MLRVLLYRLPWYWGRWISSCHFWVLLMVGRVPMLAAPNRLLGLRPLMPCWVGWVVHGWFGVGLPCWSVWMMSTAYMPCSGGVMRFRVMLAVGKFRVRPIWSPWWTVPVMV